MLIIIVVHLDAKTYDDDDDDPIQFFILTCWFIQEPITELAKKTINVQKYAYA
jgi:hypothetical protein